jgi:hypothetical protein
MAWLWLGLFCLAWLGFWLLGQANTSLEETDEKELGILTI